MFFPLLAAAVEGKKKMRGDKKRQVSLSDSYLTTNAAGRAATGLATERAVTAVPRMETVL